MDAVRIFPRQTISASTTLRDWHRGKTLLVDTSGGAVGLTISDAISADWDCTVIRSGASNVLIAGESTQSCVGPAASAGAVTIGVDYGGVGLVRLAPNATWAAGATA